MSVFTGAAAAADLTAPAPAPTWEGFYLGSYLGWAQFELGSEVATPSIDFDGGTAGTIAGYNWQSGNLVYGLEADLGFSNANAPEEYYPEINDFERAGVDWVGSVRGRIGYAFDNFLVYAAGGLAGAQLEFYDSEEFGEDTLLGWTIGAGIEAKVTETASLRLEYLYSDYGDEDFTVDGDTYNASLSSHQVRLGLNAKFAGFGSFGEPATGDWSGLYLGGHTGYALGSADITELDSGDRNDSIDVDGAVRGLQAGYNWQSGNLVFGAEADIAVSRANANIDDDFDAIDDLDLERVGFNWLSTVRARLGYSTGSFLLFATGGAAFAELDLYSDDDNGTEWFTGWTAGAGVEYQISASTSVKLDYLYVNLGSEYYEEFDSDDYDVNDLDAHIIRVGANYRF